MRHRTNPWTRAAGACFSSLLVRRCLTEFAPPRQLSRWAYPVTLRMTQTNTLFRCLIIATVLCVIALIIFVGLHEYLYTFDPYSWLNPKVESVESRNLWNHRKDLYRLLIVIFFCSSLLFGSASTIIWLRRRRVSRPTKHT
jgi:hypothetical protein